MNLSSEQETQLQDYLVEQLEPICAADPKVLSMYILALIKRDDMSTEQVREFCTTELQDFLKEETKPFIGRLFDMLHEMTSRQSGGGVKKEMDDSRRHRERRGEDFDNEDGAYDQYEDRSSSSSRRSDDSRKRRSDQGERERERSPAPYDDDSRDRKRRRAGSEEVEERSPSSQRRDRHRRDRDREDTRDVLPSSSSSSTSTTSSRRGYDQRGHEAGGRVNIDRPLSSSRGKDEIAGGGRWEGGREDSRSHPSASGSSRYDDGRGSRDYGSSRSRTGGRDTRPGGDFGGGRITGRKRGVCYDFEERGVCVKGESCEYEHLGRPLVVDEAGLSKLQSDRDTEEAGAYNPEDPFLNKTSPIPVWHGPTSRTAPPVPRGGRGVAGPGLLNPPMLPLPPMPHPQRLGNQGVLPLPSVPMLPPHQMPYHGGDGLMPTPGSQPYPSRGMRGMRGRGRGGYHQRPSYEDEGMFRTETESAITDTANFGGNRPPYDSHYGDNQGGGRGFNRFKRGRYEGDYGHRGARPPKPQTDSICVARIPQELNTISQLNAHFQKFGNIVNIQLDPANKQAFVQFTSNAEALLALRSPEAVMNNRFIQVYLKKDEAQEGGAPAPVVPQPPRPAVRPVPTSTVPQPAMMSRTPTSLVVQPAAAAAAQPKSLELKKKQQELLSKQLEQQKKLLQLLEKMKGTTSKEKDEVKAQLTALTAKIGEAMKKAREGVAKQTAAPVVGAAPTAATSWKKLSADSEKQRLDRELELLAKSKAATETSTNGVSTKSTTSEAGASPELSVATGTSPLPAPTKEADQSRMEALQKTLASLQEEAKQLGIPASQIAAQVTGVPSLSGPRGRGVGMRARAAPWWGRGRGRGGRGRGFASAPRSFKLDNRTTVICVHDVPQELRDEALLRAHFQAFGEVISLAMQPDSNNFLVQFTQRFMAEQAMQKGTALQGHILNMSWHDSTQSGGEAGEQLELADTEAENQEEVEEYQGGETFVEEPFAVAEEEIDIDEDKEERSWKRE